jgi:hypothetical protein
LRFDYRFTGRAGGCLPWPIGQQARLRAVITILAVLCSLAQPGNCHEQVVTTSDFANVSMQSCLMGAPQLADWMKEHPDQRLAAWRCVVGKRSRGA